MRRLGAAALLMTTAMFLSRVIGYLREAYIAARFGASSLTDAFYAAFTLPDWLSHLVAGGTLSITFLPVYARYLATGDEQQANRVLGTVATVMLAAVGGGVLLGELLAGPIVRGFFHRLDPASIDECVRMTRILLPAQIFFFAGGLASATLFARGKFAAQAASPLIYNVGIIAGGIALGGLFGIEGLAWGALAGAIVGPFLIPAISAWRHGARVRPSFDTRHPGFVEWLKLSLPLMVGVSMVTADEWLLRYFAGDEAGALTRLTYAKRLVAVPIAVAGQAIGTASMPFFARLHAEGKRAELADTVARTLRGTGIVSALIAAAMIGVVVPLVDILFHRGEFRTSDVAETALYTAIFAAAVPLWALQGLFARVFYAARNTWTPMVAGTIVTVVSVPLYALLYRATGPAGLAVASGVVMLAHTGALVLLLPRVLPELSAQLPAVGRRIGAALILAAAGGVAAWAAAAVVTALVPLQGKLLALAACAGGGLAFTAVVALAADPLGIEEPEALARRILARLRRRRA